MGIQWPAHWLPTRRQPFRESGRGESSQALNSATSWCFSENWERTVWCARVCFIFLLRAFSTPAEECVPTFHSFINGAMVNKGRNIKKIETSLWTQWHCLIWAALSGQPSGALPFELPVWTAKCCTCEDVQLKFHFHHGSPLKALYFISL